MSILDKYILKRYLLTFAVMLLLFVPIGVMLDLAEKIAKMVRNEAPTIEILKYYMNFIIYIGSLLFPIFLFLSIIFFTSKLASNTEIVAILSSGVSFGRFLRPYFMGATIIAVLMFVMAMFIVPKASLDYHEFIFKYLKKGKKFQETSNIYNQLNENEFLYISNFDPNRQLGSNFVLEHFNDDDKLAYKLTASSIRWIPKDTVYRLTGFTSRVLKEDIEVVEKQSRLDTIFNFKIDDLTPVSYVAETKNIFELNEFIEDQRKKGASNINTYVMAKYKRWALPVSAFILTLIAVSVSSIKRRGGMGLNLAFGIVIAFVYIFFDRVFAILAEKAGLSPLIAIIIPNAIFAVIGLFLLKNAKR
ncbi:MULTISPECIES: LptF/LptG family permease [unclassified Cellulophaga]|uniref:LptF/LptG family permease n=1 Tax=unclassified Cellulophaga TaxID=2634405 RepID=UPI0026E34612|nr:MULTISPECIES: LptF/LptG family permease [unclassified Cellulophaga]MDO6493020.1 LptF/LptG family permease [Cellulophaga sp. 2_MG-2023]MDO6495996.1 LptF/LptG family permease [Cellulophaga sp. 3_MG-2023]